MSKMLIWGLEWVQVHPLDIPPKKLVALQTTSADAISSNFLQSMFGGITKKCQDTVATIKKSKKRMTTAYAKKFFGINDEDLELAKAFNS